MDQSKNKKRIKNPNFSVLEKGKEAEERKPGWVSKKNFKINFIFVLGICTLINTTQGYISKFVNTFYQD